MTLLRSNDPALLFPPFRDRLLRALGRAREAGLDAFLFEGWRSPYRQTALYAQGRTAPGQIVTNATAWQSWHQYGLAGDVVFGGPGKWTWAGDYARLGPMLEAEGLVWYGAPGASFKETPHFEMTFGLSLAECEALAKGGGTMAVWERAMAAYEAAQPKQT